MAKKDVRMYSAERDKLAERHKETTIGDVMDAIRSIEDNIGKIFSSHIENLEEKLEATNGEETKTPVDDIMVEIHAMNDHIEATKQEIAALKPKGDTNSTMSSATEELGEVVKATEEAANTILENAEQIDAIVSELHAKISKDDPEKIVPDVEKLELISMNLLTACSFQDITGQRINKVVNSLNYIEERLQKLIEIWNIEHGTADVQDMTFAKGDDREGKDMLHGPQSSDGMDQDDIDALFD